MGFSSIFDILGVVFKQFTPEKIKSRARMKLNKLKEEERALLDKEPTRKNSVRIIAVRRNIKRLQAYFANN